MSVSDAYKVLQQKVRVGRNGYEARVLTPARAVRLSLARAAEELFDLSLVVNGVHVSQVKPNIVLEQFRDEWLIMVLDGPDGELGAVAVDMQILGALVENQTLGKVLPNRAESRPSTQTDAALFAPLIDRALAEMAAGLDQYGGNLRAGGFRFGARMESVRTLGLLLESPEFHLFRMDIDMGDGAKQGEMVLALPVAMNAGRMEKETREDCSECDEDVGHDLGLLGRSALMEAEICLDAVLWRKEMLLSEIETLSPGDVLEIPREVLVKTRLQVGLKRMSGTYTLGQMNGFRAVRLNVAAGNKENVSGSNGNHEQDTHTTPGIDVSMPLDMVANERPKTIIPDNSGEVMASTDLDKGYGVDEHLLSQEDANQTPDLPDLSDLPGLSGVS